MVALRKIPLEHMAAAMNDGRAIQDSRKRPLRHVRLGQPPIDWVDLISKAIVIGLGLVAFFLTVTQ